MNLLTKKVVEEKRQKNRNLIYLLNLIKKTFIRPLSKQVLVSNTDQDFCSREWAEAYIETNELIASLNEKLNEEIEKTCRCLWKVLCWSTLFRGKPRQGRVRK